MELNIFLQPVTIHFCKISFFLPQLFQLFSLSPCNSKLFSQYKLIHVSTPVYQIYFINNHTILRVTFSSDKLSHLTPFMLLSAGTIDPDIK